MSIYGQNQMHPLTQKPMKSEDNKQSPKSISEHQTPL